MVIPDRGRTKPTWWLLYAIGLLLAVLLGLVEVAVPVSRVRTAIEIAVVVCAFVLARFWFRHNRVAIELEGQK